MYDLIWIYLGEASVIDSGLSFEKCTFIAEYLYNLADEMVLFTCEVKL